MKHKTAHPNVTRFPDTAERVIHPLLGIRCWLVDKKYYRSKNDYLNPPVVKGEDGRVSIVDTSIKL